MMGIGKMLEIQEKWKMMNNLRICIVSFNKFFLNVWHFSLKTNDSSECFFLI